MRTTKRQEEIIKCAGKILTEKGVSGLTTKNLSKAIGFTESALYRHFESKEAIVLAMLDYIKNEADEFYSKALDSAQSPEENFKALFKARLNFFATHPYFVVVVFSNGLMDDNEAIRKAIHNMMSITIKYLTPILKEGQENGMFAKEYSIEEICQILMGTFSIQMFKWRMADFSFDIEKEGERFIEILLSLIKSR